MTTILGKLFVWGKGLAKAKRYKKLLKQFKAWPVRKLTIETGGMGRRLSRTEQNRKQGYWLLKAPISGMSKKSGLINCIVDGKKSESEF